MHWIEPRNTEHRHTTKKMNLWAEHSNEDGKDKADQRTVRTI